MNIVFYLSSKYLKFKAGERGISSLGMIALLTVIVGSACSVVILSAVNGFHNSTMQKFMNKDAHLIFINGRRGISNYNEYIDKLKLEKGIINVYPYLEFESLIKINNETSGAYIIAIPEDLYFKDKGFSNTFIVESGEFDLNSKRGIILGANLAFNIGAKVGDTVYLLVYNDDFIGLQYKFIVKGTVSGGYAEYDKTLAFINFKDGQEILNFQGKTHGIAVKVENPLHIERYILPLRAICPYYYHTWKTLNRNTLIAMENEKMLVMIILSFFFIVVAFNILSAVISMIIDKKYEIAILKAIGLKAKDILYVFLIDGFLIGIFGSGLGSVIGLLISVTLNDILKFIENVINLINRCAYLITSIFFIVKPPADFRFFDTTVYYISEFPILIKLSDIIFIIIMSIVLSTLAVLYPAYTASKLKPIEVLHND